MIVKLSILKTTIPMLSDELEKLKALHDTGELSDVEYAAAKERLLKSTERGDLTFGGSNDRLLGLDVKTYIILMHLSQYAGLLVPFAGLIVPVGLWLYARDSEPAVDAHGKEILNWMISFVVYVICSAFLILLLIGLPLMAVVILLDLIFPIVAAVAASEGRLYRYPFTIRFFSQAM
jgi:uncharacterized protein